MNTIPTHLSHTSIVSVAYEQIDCQANQNAGDAKYLSIGRATWDKNDISAKVFRKAEKRWSPQSEELPLWRTLDLAILVISVITNQDCYLHPDFIPHVSDSDRDLLNNFIKKDWSILEGRLLELKRLTQNCGNSNQEGEPLIIDV